MEPELLPEAVRCPPTFSWWALEIPVTLIRRGSCKRPCGGRGGGCNRSERRSCAAIATTGVLLNTARSDGLEFQKGVRSC